jgi:hypothetical protein
MRKQMWKLALALALLLACVTTLLWLFPPPPSRVTRAAFEKIEEGMTLAEVEAIMGGPAGSYLAWDCELHLDGTPEIDGEMWDRYLRLKEPRHDREEEWWGDEGRVFVFFDKGGRVVMKDFCPGTRGRLSPLEVLRVWLRLDPFRG